MNEADIIARFFRDLGAQRADVPTGIGDDAAVLAPPGPIRWWKVGISCRGARRIHSVIVRWP